MGTQVRHGASTDHGIPRLSIGTRPDRMHLEIQSRDVPLIYRGNVLHQDSFRDQYRTSQRGSVGSKLDYYPRFWNTLFNIASCKYFHFIRIGSRRCTSWIQGVGPESTAVPEHEMGAIKKYSGFWHSSSSRVGVRIGRVIQG